MALDRQDERALSEFLLDNMDEVAAAMEAEGKSANTIKAYMRYIEDFACWCDRKEGMTPDELTASVIMQYVNSAKLKPSIKVQCKYALIWLVTWLVDSGFEEINETRIKRRLRAVKTPKPERQPTLPVRLLQATMNDLRTMRTANSQRDLLALMLMMDEWLRVGEVCRISTVDVMPGQLLHVRGKGGAECAGVKRVTACIPLNESVWLQMRRYVDFWRKPAKGEGVKTRFENMPTDAAYPLFTSSAGSQISEQSLRKAIVRHLRRNAVAEGIRVDWRRIGPHAIRRTMATRAYKSGAMNLVEVQRKLRHSNIETTGRYLRIEDAI